MLKSANIDFWFRIKGDENLRVDYDLHENSLVIDAGAYIGNWAKKILQKYNCRVVAYEPSAIFFKEISRCGHKKLIKFRKALSDRNSKFFLSHDNDASYLSLSGKESVETIDVYEEALKWGKVDLMKINVEGDEYPILERLIEKDIVKNFSDLQIQFHKFDRIDNPVGRRNFIRNELSKTHYLTYDFDFIWENWRIKK